MRNCIRCDSEMIEECGLRSAPNHKVYVSEQLKSFMPKVIDEVTVAVCPNCGEVSMYIRPDKIKCNNK